MGTKCQSNGHRAGMSVGTGIMIFLILCQSALQALKVTRIKYLYKMLHWISPIDISEMYHTIGSTSRNLIRIGWGKKGISSSFLVGVLCFLEGLVHMLIWCKIWFQKWQMELFELLLTLGAGWVTFSCSCLLFHVLNCSRCPSYWK